MSAPSSQQISALALRLCLTVGMAFVLAAPWSSLAEDSVVNSEFEPTDLCPIQGESNAISGAFEDPHAEWLFCLPTPDRINGSLVVYAHGTVDVTEKPGSIEAIESQLDFGDVSIPALLNGLGFSFAVVARSKTGLSVPEGIEETKRLVDLFRQTVNFPVQYVYVIGASQGGLIGTLLNEVKQNDRFAGALAVCSPHGKFRGQLRYFFDFAVLFDYFFRDILRKKLGIVLLKKRDGKPYVPNKIIDNWETGKNYKDAITDIIGRRRQADVLSQALECAHVPTDTSGGMSEVDVAEELVEASFLGINDTVTTLGGNPVGNRTRSYICSSNPARLNRGVKRFRTHASAKRILSATYETAGELNTPLVTLHNLPDQRVPFWHEGFYFLKTLPSRSTEFYTPFPVPRFGHCDFEAAEALTAFGLLIQQTTGLQLTRPQ